MKFQRGSRKEGKNSEMKGGGGGGGGVFIFSGITHQQRNDMAGNIFFL